MKRIGCKIATTALAVLALAACGGNTLPLGSSSGAVKAASANTASAVFASKKPAISYSAAAKTTAAAAVGGKLTHLLPVAGSKVVNVADYGANGKDRGSDTDAITKALAAAGKGGTVIFPVGTYYCADVKVPSDVTLLSMTTYGFETNGTTVLTRNTRAATSILNLTGASNVTISGIAIEGLGATATQSLSGVKLVNAKNIDINDCRITTGGKGPAVYVENSTNVTVRNSMLHGSSYGVQAVSGSNLLLLNNWLTSDHPAGYYGSGSVKNVRITGNRIEWCGTGVLLESVTGHTIVGDYFDRCSIGGIRVTGGSDISMLGNVNQRNGPDHTADNSCNLYLNGVSNSVYRGNVMEAIQGDGADTNVSPEFAMILRSLKGCQIVYNASYHGYTSENLKDYGGHSGTTISNNVGTKR